MCIFSQGSDLSVQTTLLSATYSLRLESRDPGAVLHTILQTAPPGALADGFLSSVNMLGANFPHECAGRWGLMGVVCAGHENATFRSKLMSQWVGFGKGVCLFQTHCHMKRSGVPRCEHSIQRFVLARLEVRKFTDLGLPTLPEAGESKRQSLQITLAWQSVWVVQKGLWLRLPGANSQGRSGNTDSLAHPL